MSTMYLVNTVYVQLGTNSYKEFAGNLIPDNAAIQAAIQAAGGILASSTDAAMIAAAATVAKRRAGGANEETCNALMLAAYCSSVTAQRPAVMTVDLPLATIQGKTSTVAFNIGAALPAGAYILRRDLKVLATITGGTISACTATIQAAAETAGAVLGSTDVFTATGTFNTAGGDDYPGRGGQQLQMTLTATGDTLAHATTGHLAVDVLYIVP